jgi:hypothetical protein
VSNLGIAGYVLGALLTLYIVAATWRSKDADARRDARRRR